MDTPFRIFVSAVSGEFATARAAVASDLRARGLEVKIQEDFRQEAETDTTLSKLERYIRGCNAVVALIGTRSGNLPPPAAAAPFAHILPAGITEASYTQWEILFARHHGRRLSFYVTGPEWIAEQELEAGDRADLQAALRTYLVDQLGLDRNEALNTVDALCRAVLREDWPVTRAATWFGATARLTARFGSVLLGTVLGLLCCWVTAEVHYQWRGSGFGDVFGPEAARLLLALSGIVGGYLGWWRGRPRSGISLPPSAANLAQPGRAGTIAHPKAANSAGRRD